MDSPRECECHGEPMYWHKMNDRPSGGLWRCSVRRREWTARYQASDKGRRRSARYDASDKGSARVARYEEQPHRQLAKQLQAMTRVRIAY